MTQILSDLPEYCCLVFVYDTVPYKRDARMKKIVRGHPGQRGGGGFRPAGTE